MLSLYDSGIPTRLIILLTELIKEFNLTMKLIKKINDKISNRNNVVYFKIIILFELLNVENGCFFLFLKFLQVV